MASLGGYGAVDGSSAVSGNASGGRDFLDISQTVTSAGDVSSFDVFLPNAMPASHTLKLKIWRLNGANYDYVGESQAFDSLPLGANNGLTLTTAITGVQVGDIIGIWLSQSAANMIDVDANAGNDVVYKSGDASTSQATSSYTSLADFSMCVEVHGTAGSGTTINASVATVTVVAHQATVTQDLPTNINASVAAVTVAAHQASVSQDYGLLIGPLVNNTNSTWASTSSITVDVHDLSTGTLIVRKTGLTSDVSGNVFFTDPALASSTQYDVRIKIGTGKGTAEISTGA